MLFEKEALTTEQLLDKLVERGLEVGDPDSALRVLSAINYYRLATYWYEHRITDAEGNHHFKPGTRLEQILDVYQFDSDLRTLVFKAIEDFEISLRQSLASRISLNYGPFAHLNPTFVKSREKWANTVTRIHSEYQASHEEFARHHLEKYGEYLLPPIWVSVELTTLGGLRHIFQNWSVRADRQAISSEFGMEEPVFDSWLEHLETVRNVCAHHARLWNRRFAKKPKLPNKLEFPISGEFNKDQKKLPHIYNTLVLLDYVNNKSLTGSHLLADVRTRLSQTPSIKLSRLGFQVDESLN